MPDGGQLRLTGKSGERAMKRLLRNQKRAKIDAELPALPDAHKIIEGLEKRIAALEKDAKMRAKQQDTMWKWFNEKGRGK